MAVQQVDPNNPTSTAPDWFAQQGIADVNQNGMITSGFSPIPFGNGVAPPNDYVNKTPPAASGTADAGVPSYVNLSDPTQKLVWQGFAQKGITPRDQSDFQYWVDHVNASGGTADAGNAAYWTSRLAQSQGGAGDYLERPEQGSSSTLGQMAAPTTPQPTYTLPTLADLQNTPGYQFAEQQGDLGVQRAAAAKGSLLSGGTLTDLSNYNQNLANTTYQQAVGNSLGAFNANLGANQQGFNQGLATNQFNLGAQNQFFGQGLAQNENAFNQYNTNQNTAFNQWLSVANLGNPGNPFS